MWFNSFWLEVLGNMTETSEISGKSSIHSPITNHLQEWGFAPRQLKRAGTHSTANSVKNQGTQNRCSNSLTSSWAHIFSHLEFKNESSSTQPAFFWQDMLLPTSHNEKGWAAKPTLVKVVSVSWQYKHVSISRNYKLRNSGHQRTRQI